MDNNRLNLGLRKAVILFLLVSLIVIPSSWAQKRGDRISIDFHDADIRAVIKFISELTGKNFVVDSKVKGKVTVISPTKITIEEAYRMFESILEVEGYTTVPAGKAIKIIPAREAKEKGVQAVSPREGMLYGDRIITRIIHLRFIDAEKGMQGCPPYISIDQDDASSFFRQINTETGCDEALSSPPLATTYSPNLSFFFVAALFHCSTIIKST